MPETRKISYGSPYLKKGDASGFIDSYLNTVMEIPMMAYEALQRHSGYTPGELRSSPRDEARAARYAWEEYLNERMQEPEYAQRAGLGRVAGYAFDPFIDTAAALAPGLAAGRLGNAMAGTGRSVIRGLERRVAEPQRGIFVGEKLNALKEPRAKSVTDDLLKEIIPLGAEVNKKGLVTVYHRTSKENAKKIRETGEMVPKEDGIFFSTKPSGQSVGYGEEVVEMKIPAKDLMLDDVFSDEAHLRLPAKANKVNDVSVYLRRKE